ncbi:MAG: ATP-binding protein [Kofleriaceae bacterium]
MSDSTSDLDHLRDHLGLCTTSIDLRLRLTAPEPDSAYLARATSRLQRFEARIAERSAAVPSLSASLLAQRLSLTTTEMMVVWLGAALAMSPEARSLLTRVTGEVGPDPTLGAIKMLVHGELPAPAALSELSARGTLRSLGILERTDTGAAHESRQTWALSPRVLALLHGHNDIDGSLARICRVGDVGLPLEEIAAADDTITAARRVITRNAVVIAAGLPGVGRRTLLAAAAQAEGLGVLQIDARSLASDHELLARQLRTIARECRLLERAPLITNLDLLVGETTQRLDLVGSELVPHIRGAVLATTGARHPALHWDRPAIVIEVGHPSSPQLERLWARTLGTSTDDAECLASHYPLAPALIHRAAHAARARMIGALPTLDDVRGGIRSVLEDRLGPYARRVVVTQSWDDLVLPAEQIDALVELIARVRERRKVYEHWGFGTKVGRGLGVSALLSGPPGTGKTMAAGLIARELGLELYQVDLGKVVSKWIGETEKNLGAVFDAAEAGHAIVLFDEADALFGKRTEVKTSTDRYANLETNYLLQRLESFTGVCLLTTNHDSHIDPAFQRRLSLHLRFSAPDAEQRGVLWRTMLPPAAPVSLDLELDDLAVRFPMSPGHIRNAALRAAFLAADEESAITTEHLTRAAQLECEALGRLAS